MARITLDDVEYTAGLARLSLSEEEAARVVSELDTILEYVATLNEVDTSDVEPTAHVIPLPTPMREDRAVVGIDPELVVSNAPERMDSAFVVPKVIESEDEG